VESPRFKDWDDTPEYQNAEFLLARALLRGGAVLSAERYLTRLLARGPKQPYFVAAHRALGDAAPQSKDTPRILRGIEQVRLKEPLPRDAEHERAYLRGKVAYGKGDLDAAERAFASVGRQSRLYAGALYFRGLIRARKRDFQMAGDAWCEIVDQ